MTQEVKLQSAEERKADALAAAEVFAFHIQAAIRNTPAEGISRNRIMDRCGGISQAAAAPVPMTLPSSLCHAVPGAHLLCSVTALRLPG